MYNRHISIPMISCQCRDKNASSQSQVQVGRHEHRQAQAQGCGHGRRHRDIDTSIETWTQVDWKHEHKNKVKLVKNTHQTHCRGRQVGVATTGVARHDQVQVEGMSADRCRHRDMDAGGLVM